VSPRLTVVDYGIGNLHSVIKAFRHEGGEVDLSSDPEAIASADRVLLPGVGAFADGMRGLSDRGLIEPLRRFVETGRPFLGICLGMQLLLDESEEFGTHRGLGLIPGRVVAIQPGPGRKVPQIGWNSIRPPQGRAWSDTILADLPEEAMVYFVHSFTASPLNERDRLADADYAGARISAAVQRENVIGCQFHPEKSGPVGLTVVHRFLKS
jgi:glutamine amidotransferase